ncbi:MAG: diaminobutyrate acetyltransferase [Smithellaceae bacterium]|nr:diaminobutyrate acetyltransferase [Smithellaceae bacterium]MDD5415027.1 diaminobutyrate acetyltransferase [Smithellaceae bacterium]
MQNDFPHIVFRKPVISDAQAIWKLVQTSPPLDMNSLYCYLILCAHFADTSVVVESPERLCGYISAYVPPDRQNTLFVWQVVVNPVCQGKGVAKTMLKTILQRQYSVPVSYLETTVNPSNLASDALFHSLAKTLNTSCEKRVLFSEKDFGESAHEDEILYRIGPFDTQIQKEEP